MSTETDWRAAARGIPVWLWCRAFSGRHDFVSLLVVEVGANSTAGLVNPAAPAGWPGGGGSGALTSSWFPDLTDPDTRAAYDRRLALALGCPEACADVGVRFRRLSSLSPSAGWVVEAGHDEHNFANEHSWDTLPTTIAAGVVDPLLARALAWPADKRVSR